MSLQIVIGSSGAGKSHNVYEEMIRESVCHPEKQYLVIVPDQFTMQTQKKITGMHPRKGLLNIDVLSFSRLAWRVFEETGGDDRPVLDDVGKSLVLQRVIADKKKQLRVLGRTLEKRGAAARMKSLISELLQYRVLPEDLAAIGDLPSGHGWLSAKLTDVQIVYDGFLQYLQERYLTTEEVPELLCKVIGDSSLVRGSTVILDGFTGFTPVQHLVVRKLLELCEKVTVTVTFDIREDPTRDAGMHHLFHMSSEMVRKVMALAADAHTEILPVRRIDGSVCGRHAGRDSLRFLEQNLFRFNRAEIPRQEIPAAGGQIRLLEAESPRQEILAAAEQILYMVRKEGLHFRDFAVLTGDLPVYGREAERIFASAGIPFFLDRKKPVMASQAVEFVRAAMDMLVQRYSYESVFRLLRTSLTDFSRSDTDLLENYVLALGIRGRKQYEERWVRKPRTDREDRLQQYEQLRKRFADMTAELHAGMHEKNAPARRKAEVLYKFLVSCRVQEKLAESADRFAGEGRISLSREYAQIWQVICDLLDRLSEVLGSEPMGMEAFQEVLDAGLSECSIGLVPPGEDQVMIGDIERTRLKEIKVLFFAGVNDGVVPAPVNSGGILSDADRECLKQVRMELAPTAREEICRQRFYLYLCMTRPADRLVISWSRTAAEGRAALPSWLVSAVRQMFPEIPVLQYAEDSDEQIHLETPDGCREILLHGLQGGRPGSSGSAAEAVAYRMACRSGGMEQLERLSEAASADGRHPGLGSGTARQLYGDLLVNSASRLEAFAACPFRHFLDYGLRLKQREEYDFTPADFGTVMHAALERFSGNLRREQLEWALLADSVRETLADRALEEVAHDYNNTVLHSTGRNLFVLGRMREMLLRTVWALQEQLRRGDFHPAGFEMAFTDELRSLQLSLPGNTAMKLYGRIDRIDEYTEDGVRYLKIIDYKTGSTKLDLDGLWNGTQLQLVLYLNAALESASHLDPGRTAEPAGILYYHIDDPFLADLPRGWQENLTREEKAALCAEELLKQLRPAGLVRSEPEILRHFDNTLVTGSSAVIPAALNKDGTLRKGSQAAGGEDFRVIRRFAQLKAAELGAAIMEGVTAAEPMQDGEMTACSWCPYRGICGFDEKLEGCGYRKMERHPDVLARMKEKVENGNDMDR